MGASAWVSDRSSPPRCRACAPSTLSRLSSLGGRSRRVRQRRRRSKSAARAAPRRRPAQPRRGASRARAARSSYLSRPARAQGPPADRPTPTVRGGRRRSTTRQSTTCARPGGPLFFSHTAQNSNRTSRRRGQTQNSKLSTRNAGCRPGVPDLSRRRDGVCGAADGRAGAAQRRPAPSSACEPPFNTALEPPPHCRRSWRSRLPTPSGTVRRRRRHRRRNCRFAAVRRPPA
eukprot:SAG11_NODE_2292_length_3556_cov_4.475557_3_plen_231_part_00